MFMGNPIRGCVVLDIYIAYCFNAFRWSGGRFASPHTTLLFFPLSSCLSLISPGKDAERPGCTFSVRCGASLEKSAAGAKYREATHSNKKKTKNKKQKSGKFYGFDIFFGCVS